MDEATRQFVRERAGDRCEYCRLRQAHHRLWRHQIEHVIPKKHHGSDDLENLALACIRCNLGKSSNLSGIDVRTGEIVTLFTPRKELWDEHFAYDGAIIIGITATGRATVDVLNMNEEERLRLRRMLLQNGELNSSKCLTTPLRKDSLTWKQVERNLWTKRYCSRSVANDFGGVRMI